MTAFKDDLAKAAQQGWGRGRVMVAGLWPEIEQALQEGHTRSRIWRTLYDRGELTLSYPQFVSLVRQRLVAIHSDPGQLASPPPDTQAVDSVSHETAPPSPPPPVQARPVAPPTPKSQPFNPHADISALI